MRKNNLEEIVHVAILGGAFNPVTRGHIQVALFVLEAAALFHEVWLMPCFKHIYNKKMTEAGHRLAMCELAAAKHARIKVSDYEIKKKFDRGTYYLMKELLDEDFVQNRYDFSLIIGQDNANTFDYWVEHDALKNLLRFVIVPRQGVDADPSVDWYLQSPHIYLAADRPVIKVSSTQVRELLKESNYSEAEGLLDPDVLEYIKAHDLYGK
ncbi:MAG: nicotinate (nicotinamide) nucleotide adenylyltransferase [Spirochaetales bacterium]|nr:nicotinate (nicotinamide) nucleotide adenylyltransferase [Spirochaetales bacterium]